ncbi:hypothetical protein E4O77_07670 [Neisseria meningitidis]|nr:hypothetical protein [Neisseria meningitidis]MBG8721465.1 hypothetical protein [Neisseria meningitidis]PKT97494.1 hypothetical protein CWI46_09465 [Neisseria meningitidis]PKU09015.1 hypothetical protein CWI45_12645 [Neisseria meningitidis]
MYILSSSLPTPFIRISDVIESYSNLCRANRYHITGCGVRSTFYPIETPDISHPIKGALLFLTIPFDRAFLCHHQIYSGLTLNQYGVASP